MMFLRVTKEVNTIFPGKQKATLVYTSTKLGSSFDIKNITKKKHKHGLVYNVKDLKRHVTRPTMVRQEED